MLCLLFISMTTFNNNLLVLISRYDIFLNHVDEKLVY